MADNDKNLKIFQAILLLGVAWAGMTAAAAAPPAKAVLVKEAWITESTPADE